MLKTTYAKRVYADLEATSPHQPEFLQAAAEVLASLEPVLDADPRLEANAILERITEPDRVVSFRVTWVDDAGHVQVNRAYRVEFNNAIGPYKGGLRFAPSVNLSILKFLGFEQTFKNALTGLWMGGGKGGADFDPHGKSDGEVMRFCQAFMSELYRYLGQDIDVPAGDLGVGGREIGYMFGQYKRLTREFSGVLTGKGLDFGGSLGRTEATGYGLCYYTQEALRRLRGDSLDGKTVVVSGSGNVAIFAAEKAAELGAKVVTMSDSSGYVHDPDGIDLDVVKKVKLENRGRMSEYVRSRAGARYVEAKKVWEVPCDVALPCATQNELDGDDAKALVKNGVAMVAEGANMPTTPAAIDILREAKVLYAPGKASNAGGVAVSGLEMSQDSAHLPWTFAEVDDRLRRIMTNIVAQSLTAAGEFGFGDDLMNGANIAGFRRVAGAMIAQGVV